MESNTASLGPNHNQSDLPHYSLFSPWMEIPQDLVSDFAKTTLDNQWIHTDPLRAREESPFGTTIVQGNLLLSLFPHLHKLAFERSPVYQKIKSMIYYGADRLRFIFPVPVGTKIRACFELKECRPKNSGILVTEHYSIFAEISEKPACVAEAMLLIHL